MSRNKEIRLLCAEADRERLQPVMEQLRAKGFRISDARDIKKNETVLAALSSAFYADAEKTETLFGLIGKGAENVLPLQLDGTPIPDTVKNALYARNIIPAADRDPAQIAERIAAAVPSSKSVLPKVLIACAAALAVIIGIVIWRAGHSGGEPPAETPVPTEEPQEEIYLPEGWTMEDLEKVVDVIIVGEQVELYTMDFVNQNGYTLPEWDYFSYRDYDQDGAHFYSREDGHEYTMTRYEDLRFLGMLPNLRFLSLENIETGLLPDLSGLKKLENLVVMDCVIPDLDWVGGSSIASLDLINSTGSVTDFSPLTDCTRLHHVHLDLINNRTADLAGFAPQKLNWLWINNGWELEQEPDLSALSACASLRECQLHGLPIRDIGFLPGASLERLDLDELDRLEDVSALRGMKRLTELSITQANRLRDLSPVADCSALTTFQIECDREQNPLRDVSFLQGLSKLNDIGLGGVELPDLSFLTALASRRSELEHFSVWGEIGDYSGLSAIKRYGRLRLDPDPGADFKQIMSFLSDAAIQDLQLSRFSGVDLSLVPMPSSKLELDRCTLTDLSTMPADFRATLLCLNKCSSLQSLKGLKNQSGIRNLEVYACPRVTDWSELDGMDLNRLNIIGGYTLPEEVAFHASIYRVESVADVTDLSFLDALDPERYWCFELVGLDISNLQPLSRFRGGYLAVSPELAEQAEDLVRSGNFGDFKVEYPQGGWEEDLSEISLLSLDELNTLPPALLRRVTRVIVAGDQVVDRDRTEIFEDWGRTDSNGNPKLSLYDRETDQQTPVGSGIISDLSVFSEMTGLRELELWGQPIETLDGIQNLSSLNSFTAQFCPKLTDASALFSMQNLSWVTLEGTKISSIQGVQNLNRLTGLDVSNTNVTDLSPLLACDFSAAYEENGVDLGLNGLDLSKEDFDAIGSIKKFSNLMFDDADPAIWIPALADAEIRSFGASGDFRTNGDLAAFAAGHPELKSLWIGWARDLTDLTPLIGLENLEKVTIDWNMTKAIASLDGQNYGFELEING